MNFLRYGAERMLQTQPSEANFRHTKEPGPGDFSSADVARLLSENAGLREALRSLRAQGIADRQTAHYYQTMHRKAVERLVEKDQQIEVLKSKVVELNHRIFGRKSVGSLWHHVTRPRYDLRVWPTKRDALGESVQH